MSTIRTKYTTEAWERNFLPCIGPQRQPQYSDIYIFIKKHLHHRRINIFVSEFDLLILFFHNASTADFDCLWWLLPHLGGPLFKTQRAVCMFIFLSCTWTYIGNKKKGKLIFLFEVWTQLYCWPVVLLGAAKLKVDPGAAAVVVVAPKPPNAPVKKANHDKWERGDDTKTSKKQMNAGKKKRMKSLTDI